MTSRVKMSALWDYFVINVTDVSKVLCPLCPVDVPRSGKMLRIII